MIVAHGIATRGDLPLPEWLFAYGAGFAVVISFLLLRLLWPAPRLQRLSTGRSLGEWTRPAARTGAAVLTAVALVAWAVTLVAGLVGDDDLQSNVAPLAVFVAFWVGVQVVVTVLGDLWSPINPLAAVARGVDRLRGRADPETGADHAWGAWPAVVTLLSFFWLELAYHDSGSPRAVGVWLATYSTVVIAGCAVHGRGWIRNGDGFAVLFHLLGHMGLFHRDDEGRLRVRPPFTGLAGVRARRGLTALVLVTLGATSFDGVSRTSFWIDVVGDADGWAATGINTLGLLWVIGIVITLFGAAMWVAGGVVDEEPMALADEFLHSLVPIAFAYALAHYFSLLLLDGGQGFLAQTSDPFGEGWNLFGTADWSVNFRLVGADAISWVQAAAIAGGHVVGVTAAHDRAVGLYDQRTAIASQYPVLGVMIVYTVGGLLLLLNA